MNKLKTKTTDVVLSQSDPRHATTEHVAMLAALLARLGAGLSADERGFYASSIADADAHADGTRFESGAVLDEWCRVAGLLVASVVAGKVPGCGALRLRYGCELAVKLAEQVAVHDQLVVSAAGATSSSSSSLMSSRKARRMAVRALLSLAGRDPAARARIHAAAEDAGRPDERSRSLEALAAELERVMQALPARVVADAGVTRQLVDSLRAAGRSVVAAKSTQTSERGAIAASYDVLNTLDGRVLHELRNLIAAARDARRDDRAVPAISSPLLVQRRAKKSAAKTAPAPVVTPTPRPTQSPPAVS